MRTSTLFPNYLIKKFDLGISLGGAGCYVWCLPTTAGSIKSCPMQVPATATVERNDATAMGQKSLGVPSLLTHFIDTTVETIGNI